MLRQFVTILIVAVFIIASPAKALEITPYQAIPTSTALGLNEFEIDGQTYLAFANSHDDSGNLNIDSKIYKWNGISFEEYQAIPTHGASDWESFKIDGQTYLAVANNSNGYDSYDLDSKIYKWNGTSFEEFQAIPTHKAYDWESFTIAGSTYLSVTNGFNDSKIYKWNGTSFAEFQALSTNGHLMRTKSFIIDGQTYLSTAHYRDSSFNYSVDSIIYKWNGTSFQEYQAIPTVAGVSINIFTIDGLSYLAVANGGANWDGISKIYRWDGNNFNEVQEIFTNCAVDWEGFTINGKYYLALARLYDGNTLNIDSWIYMWDGYSFQKILDIPTHGAQDWESFTINGQAYLAVANSNNGYIGDINSMIYKVEPPVPEPATMFLLGSGIIGLAGIRRRLNK